VRKAGIPAALKFIIFENKQYYSRPLKSVLLLLAEKYLSELN
jgi:hypothetical protein